MKDNNEAREVISVLLIVAFAGLMRIPSLTQPLGPDQGIMAVIGEGLLNGELPYREYWEMGSPAIFFTYALMFKIFGVSMAAIPITDTLVSMVTTFLVFLLSRSVWGRKVGYVSALVFAFFSNGVRLGMHAGGDIAFGTFWYIAQRETFMLPLIVASIYFLLGAEKREKDLWRLILSGFLTGLACVYKFPAVLIFICLFLYLNWSLVSYRGQRQLGNLLARNVALISGFVLALIPFVVFFTIRGVMSEMTEAVFTYVYSVYSQVEHDYLRIIQIGVNHTLFIAKENFIIWIFFVTSSAYIITSERNKENLLMVLWGLASVFFVISHREFFGYHYLVVLPPFSILAGYGIVKALGPDLNLRRVSTMELGKVFIILALAANLVFFATLNYTHYTKFYYYITGTIDRETYYGFFNAYPKHDYSFPADYEVAQYIVNYSKKNDMIYTLGGIESIIHFLTKRKSPSRFIFSWIIFSSGPHGRVEEAERYRRELLFDLEAKTPRYIITVRSLETFKPFSEVYLFVKENYVLEKRFADDRFVYVFNKYEG
jgi:hypothetical protein